MGAGFAAYAVGAAGFEIAMVFASRVRPLFRRESRQPRIQLPRPRTPQIQRRRLSNSSPCRSTSSDTASRLRQGLELESRRRWICGVRGRGSWIRDCHGLCLSGTRRTEGRNRWRGRCRRGYPRSWSGRRCRRARRAARWEMYYDKGWSWKAAVAGFAAYAVGAAGFEIAMVFALQWNFSVSADITF
jgi:hypothetical protein